MFSSLNEQKFKKIVIWAITSLLFFQAFPLFYFGYDLSHPMTRNFWTVGLAFPALVAIIGIIKPDLVAKTMMEGGQEDPASIKRRGRTFAIITLVLFVAAMILIQTI